MTIGLNTYQRPHLTHDSFTSSFKLTLITARPAISHFRFVTLEGSYIAIIIAIALLPLATVALYSYTAIATYTPQ